jgi:hypothetical protein
MRRVAVSMACLAFLATWLVHIGTAQSARQVRCGSGPSILETDRSRLFARLREVNRRSVPVLFGCDKRTGKKWRLGVYGHYTPTFIPTGFATLSGRYVGFVRTVCFFVNDCGQAVVVRDLKTGAVTYDSGGENLRTNIVVMLLKRDGSLVWTAGQVNGVILQKNDSTGHEVIDSGPYPVLDGSSLTLSTDGETFYWIKEGQVRAASLY